MYNRIVIKLTGHLFKSSGINNELYHILDFIKKDHIVNNRKYYLIVGGGEYARNLINALRSKGILNEELLDHIGIEVTRLHAFITSLLLKPYAAEVIPKNLKELRNLDTGDYGIIVMGGLKPGFSTNAVSAYVALIINADILITLSRAGALYTDDPQINPQAKIIREINIDEVEKLLNKYSEKAGYYPLLDRTAIRLIKQFRINTYIAPPTAIAINKILNGHNPGTKIIVE